MRSTTIRSILSPSPNRLLRRDDLIYDYGMTRDAAYAMLNRFGIRLGGGLYIKRSVLDKVLEGNGKLA
jgi:hypothetical protein